jgi:hypothetical protein
LSHTMRRTSALLRLKYSALADAVAPKWRALPLRVSVIRGLSRACRSFCRMNKTSPDSAFERKPVSDFDCRADSSSPSKKIHQSINSSPALIQSEPNGFELVLSAGPARLNQICGSSACSDSNFSQGLASFCRRIQAAPAKRPETIRSRRA